jgi:RNA polymerase sigma-70 factor (ECF subfamily)
VSQDRPDPPPDWAERIRAGDRGAYEELFRTFYAPLVSYATRILFAPDLAEEVVQEVFLAIWKNHATLPAENLSAYLYGAVRRSSTSHLRHAQVEKRWRERVALGENILPIGATAAADERTRFNELIAAVRVAVEELQPRMRQAFLLRRQHGLSYNEIAQVMGITPKTVEVHIGAALRVLRGRLARFYE